MSRASKDLTEHPISSEVVYDGKLLHVRRDKVRLPDGAVAEREYVRHPGAVLIIAVLENGELVMERQFRYPLRRDMIELPAGKIDPGEPPLETAKRELLEETGYAASGWRHLATIHLAIGYSDEHIEIFLAEGLAQREAKLDDGNSSRCSRCRSRRRSNGCARAGSPTRRRSRACSGRRRCSAARGFRTGNGSRFRLPAFCWPARRRHG